jgi:hypothetical protein
MIGIAYNAAISSEFIRLPNLPNHAQARTICFCCNCNHLYFCRWAREFLEEFLRKNTPALFLLCHFRIRVKLASFRSQKRRFAGIFKPTKTHRNLEVFKMQGFGASKAIFKA